MPIVRKRILGLDLGSHTVKAVELRQLVRGLEVGTLKSMPVDSPDDPRPLAERLRDFLQTHDLPLEHVVCQVPGDRLTSRRLRFPFRDRRKLAQAVPFAVEDEVPFDLEDFLVDWEIVGGERSEAEVAATVAPRIEVAHVLDLLRAAEAEPRVIEAEGLLLSNLTNLFDLPGARVLLDLGDRKTTLCLCVDGTPIAARTLSLGGRVLTQAIARERNLTLLEAERVKCEEGVLRDEDTGGVPGAVATLERLSRELVRTLGSFEPLLAARGAGAVEEITLVGGAAHLPKLDLYLTERVGVPAALLAPPSGPAGTAFLAAGDPALFGAAAALALRGASRPRTRMNFRQQEFALRFDFRELRRQLRWTAVLAGTTAVLAGVAAGASIFLQSRRAEALEQEVARLYSQAFPNQALPPDVLRAMQSEVRAAHDRADFLGVYRGNLSALDLLTEISARVGADLDVVFEELNIDRQVVRVRGHSKSFEAVDRLRQQLSSFEPFAQIKVSEIKKDARRGTNSFSVTISLSAVGESA